MAENMTFLIFRGKFEVFTICEVLFVGKHENDRLFHLTVIDDPVQLHSGFVDSENIDFQAFLAEIDLTIYLSLSAASITKINACVPV